MWPLKFILSKTASQQRNLIIQLWNMENQDTKLLLNFKRILYIEKEKHANMLIGLLSLIECWIIFP